MAIMFLNLKSKLKPLLNLCRTFCNAPLPDVGSEEDKSKFIVAQSTGPGSLKCLFISIEDTTTTALKVEKHINYPKRFHNPVATCNGLVLLLFEGSYDKATNTKTSPAGEALWNPTTNELKILPPSPASLDPSDAFYKPSFNYFGFGFDSASEDYKVIRFLEIKGKTPGKVSYGYWTPMVVELYSLATNSWKPVNIPPHVPYGWGIHVNDSYYWLNNTEPGFIMSFNFSTEMFASCPPIHVPQSDNLDSPYFNVTLVEFRGSLGAVVVTVRRPRNPISNLEVWVWDDDIWTWSLVSTFDVPSSMSEWSLIGSDKIIFVDANRDVMFFDYATGKLENIAGAARVLVNNILPFVESYIPLGNNN